MGFVWKPWPTGNFPPFLQAAWQSVVGGRLVQGNSSRKGQAETREQVAKSALMAEIWEYEAGGGRGTGPHQ